MGIQRHYLYNGRVKVEIKGQNIERFFNISSNRKLLVEQIHTVSSDAKEICFETTPKDFKRMKEVARKTGVRLRIIGRHGLPFFLHKNRKRKLLGIGAVAFFVLLYMCSFFIWDISFEGNHHYTDDVLYECLETIPIYHGMRKSEISCEAVEAELRNVFQEITWVSAEIKGTRLILRIKENEVLTKPMEQNHLPCDLIANKSGKITQIVVREGLPKVKIGDVVEPGMVLVDGTIPIYDDSEVLILCHEKHADAEVFAETKYMINKMIERSVLMRVRTGKVRNGVFIRVLGIPFYITLPGFQGDSWEVVTEQKQIHLFENFYLPFHYGSLSAYAYEEYEHFYSEEEMERIGEKLMQEYIENLSEKGIQILESDGRIEFNESGWNVMGTITAIEDIAEEAFPDGKNEEN